MSEKQIGLIILLIVIMIFSDLFLARQFVEKRKLSEKN